MPTVTRTPQTIQSPLRPVSTPFYFDLDLIYKLWCCGVDAGSSSRGQSGRKPKILNLLTVKFHFLGDYVRHIRLFGTTDSYSTQLVGVCHCQINSTYSL